ncbi:Ig-like domain-containing protein [Methanotorris formicicus]|uniref:Ig-like domain-containing protein n=1 Tax=Methanotorris formicicus TaxID=213185 RepID=UPI00064EC1F7|nr:Ig-like domain-containing protein [Methanotorris formicicus]
MRVLAFVFLMLLVGNVFALGINPNNVDRDDQYTYDYFTNTLNSFSSIFERMIYDNESYLDDSVLVFNELDLLRNETILYKNHNISSSVEYVIPPFYKFSKELVYLSNLNKRLYDDLNENTTESLIDAKATFVGINKTLLSMECILNEIDNITYLKKGNETLKFDTSNVREMIKLYKLKFSKYNVSALNISISKLLEKTPNKLRIYISNPNPIIFENVSIYGVGENGMVVVHINNISYSLFVKDHAFSMGYSFDKEGIYEIYATQNGNKSNTIYANVSKIPTYIFTDKNVYKGYVNNNITINGYVVDYYGNPINGTVHILNNSIPLNNSSFTYNIFSNKSCKINGNIFYNGDTYHLPSKKVISIEFTKYPTKIVIYTDKCNVSPHETINLIGEIFGVSDVVGIDVIVNNQTYKKIYTNGRFKTNLSFNSSGTYEIYAIYQGSNIYEGSKSNILKINVEKRGFLIYIVIAIALGLISIYTYKFTKRKEDETEYVESPKIEVKEEVDRKNIPNDIGEAYKILFDSLIKHYSLPKNLTPRELLEIIKNKNLNIYNDLRFITKIHEMHVYGGFEIDKDVVDKYLQLIKKILGEING